MVAVRWSSTAGAESTAVALVTRRLATRRLANFVLC